MTKKVVVWCHGSKKIVVLRCNFLFEQITKYEQLCMVTPGGASRIKKVGTKVK